MREDKNMGIMTTLKKTYCRKGAHPGAVWARGGGAPRQSPFERGAPRRFWGGGGGHAASVARRRQRPTPCGQAGQPGPASLGASPPSAQARRGRPGHGAASHASRARAHGRLAREGPLRAGAGADGACSPHHRAGPGASGMLAGQSPHPGGPERAPQEAGRLFAGSSPPRKPACPRPRGPRKPRGACAYPRGALVWWRGAPRGTPRTGHSAARWGPRGATRPWSWGGGRAPRPSRRPEARRSARRARSHSLDSIPCQPSHLTRQRRGPRERPPLRPSGEATDHRSGGAVAVAPRG